MDESVRKYFSALGKKGGKKSRRKLTPEEAREMAKKSWEARRAREAK
jgi:hypothetical protein